MTISEIAKMAGVSSAAVSRYFNNGYISNEKKEAIRKVVEETGYRPSVQAQMLRTKKTKTIGVLLPRIDSNSMGKVVSGIMNELDKSQYRMLMATTQNDTSREEEFLRIFSDKQVDGILLLATELPPEMIRIIREISVPLVVIGQNCRGLDCVYHDDYHAEYDLTRLVLEKGIKRPAYIGVTMQDIAVGQERYKGYCDAVSEAGLSDCKDRMITADFSMPSGYSKMKELLELYPDIDAVICATDRIAAGASQYLHTLEPDRTKDILIAGQGDSDLAACCSPQIITIRYYYEESGRTGVQRLLEVIEQNQSGQEAAFRSVKLGYTLIDR